MEDLTDAIDEQFGEGSAANYTRLAKAMRALVTMGHLYYRSQAGSELESQACAKFDLMIADMLAQPEKATAMIEALVAIIVHQKEGGTWKEWYETLGLEPEIVPGVE